MFRVEYITKSMARTGMGGVPFRLLAFCFINFSGRANLTSCAESEIPGCSPGSAGILPAFFPSPPHPSFAFHLESRQGSEGGGCDWDAQRHRGLESPLEIPDHFRHIGALGSRLDLHSHFGQRFGCADLHLVLGDATCRTHNFLNGTGV